MEPSVTSDLDKALRGVRIENIQLEGAVGVVYFHRCAKLEVTIVENTLAQRKY